MTAPVAMTQVWAEDVHRELHSMTVRVTDAEGFDIVVSMPDFVSANQDVTVSDLLELLAGKSISFGGGVVPVQKAEVLR